MTARESRIAEFNHSQRMIGSNEKIKNSLNLSILKQKFYAEDPAAVPMSETTYNTSITVTKNRTMEAGRYWSKKGNTAVLNFASATTPGGGVLKGSSAQEECLCRVSTLWNCLNQDMCWHKYYKPNRDAADVIHNSDIIYTPKVIVFKDDDYKVLDEKDYFYVDVITCAAPNLRDVPNNGWCNEGESNEAKFLSDEDLYKVHFARAIHILSVAAGNKIKNLVLGAFGCGAFRNNPEVVAKAYKDALANVKCFENVEFAVYCKDYETVNYDTFKSVLEA